jgi:hypothetical protein
VDFLVDYQTLNLVKSLAALFEEAFVLVAVDFVLQKAVFRIDVRLLISHYSKILTL